jgi:hypothetical protein
MPHLDDANSDIDSDEEEVDDEDEMPSPVSLRPSSSSSSGAAGATPVASISAWQTQVSLFFEKSNRLFNNTQKKSLNYSTVYPGIIQPSLVLWHLYSNPPEYNLLHSSQ